MPVPQIGAKKAMARCWASLALGLSQACDSAWSVTGVGLRVERLRAGSGGNLASMALVYKLCQRTVRVCEIGCAGRTKLIKRVHSSRAHFGHGVEKNILRSCV